MDRGQFLLGTTAAALQATQVISSGVAGLSAGVSGFVGSDLRLRASRNGVAQDRREDTGTKLVLTKSERQALTDP